MLDPKSFEDDIYQAAFLPETWPALLDRISCAIGAEGALLANVSDAKLPWIASDGVLDLYTAFFNEGWAFNNPRTEALVNIPHSGFMSDADHLDEAWMSRQSIYRDFLWPRGFGYAAGTTVKSPGGVTIGISIDKRRDAGPVSRTELQFLDLLRPHLSRAAVLANRLEFAKIDAALQALKIASIPAATIRSDGRLLGTNSLFERFASGIQIGAADRLCFANATAEQFYRSIGRNRDGKSGRSYPLRATDQTPPAILHFVPIVGVAREIFLRAAYFLLITPVGQNQTPTAQLIQGMFDLSPAESHIAEKLARGFVIAEIADAAELSVETIRTHVKSILAKSGMRSQRDFVSALSSIQTIGAPD
ncbi:helix-turn-helix transcriptional regulator [Rhizobium sp. DKSPLA3]|uniref:Helix-turn-helix transcriptional regulator n=1 Tax=Rhizobium quercicola TaxID=2901226 RepID=A0A9X1NU50_9HYPH|nr:helix-turn-helix transcriptional regulator [Rhizobium quercicola]MCD7111182.1 helix-turn-helix transcriptional regulator [Rhizobium quercicola]